MDDASPPQQNRTLVTGAVMAATIMNSLDSTIANVALPHIQGSVSASADQITWVLTSYIVAAAIFTPLTGWLAGRFSRKRLMQVSIVGFTIASGLCGIAGSLTQIVGFRLLQGIFGAALVPMSQAILLDINPPERHGQAMAVWGMGAILGPILGPALGGWLTDNLTWRWVFFINLPVGVVAFFGISLMKEARAPAPPRLDLLGFALLGIAIGSLQMMLDRGQQLDWFSATEIRIEAVCAALFFYLFAVQTLTAERPFVRPAIFKDRNFLFGSVFGFFLGLLLFSVLAVLPPLLENLLGYPVVTTGLVTAPRGVGTLISMTLVGRLIRRIDARILIFVGMALVAVAMRMMSGFSLYMGENVVIASGFVQGLGTGLVFVPLTTLAFATLAPSLRNEGSALFTLIRNIGSSIGISVLSAMNIRNAEIVHARLAAGVRPDNPLLRHQLAQIAPERLPAWLGAANAEVTRQATMVSYVDGFWFLLVVTLCAMPMILLMRRPRRSPAGESVSLHMD